ncbi:MAG: MMPL family transporter [Eubacteriales bacterium]|nr:MMPL family transporter [Eubacteriales bacterium]
MRRFSGLVLRHRKLIVIAAVILSILSFFAMLVVEVDYDLASYLPESSPTAKALKVVGDDNPNLKFYIKDVSLDKALEIKHELSKADYVNGVLWLDDMYDIKNIPFETVPKDILSSWYSENGVLYMITIDPMHYAEGLKAIKALYPNSISGGNAANQAQIISVSTKEIAAIMPLILPIVLAILIVSTSNYFEPVLFLLAIGVAILLNEGSNIFFGKVSFITRASSAVLQLAVSIDYAVFLLHRFAEFRSKGMDNYKAMEEAIVQSASSIASSAMTTVFGFLALTVMEFELGKNMGFVLAKGVFLSYISVIVFLPAVAISCTKLLDKTAHRPFMPSFKKTSIWIVKHALPVAIVFLLLVMPAFLGQRANTFIYGSSGMHAPGSKIKQEEGEINRMFGESQSMMLLVPEGDLAKVQKLTKELKNIDNVSSIISYPKAVGLSVPVEMVPKDSLLSLRSSGYDRIIITASTNTEGKEAFKLVEDIRALSNKHYGDQYLLAGENVANLDMKTVITKDNLKVLLGGIIAIGIILLINFKSLSLPFVLLLVIEGAVWINLSLPYFQGIDLNYIGYQIISSVQLGATVDYAILLTRRYLEARKSMHSKDAAVFTLRATTGSILPPTFILTSAGYLLGFVSTNGVISQLGAILGRGAAMSALMTLILLPHLLIILDRLIKKTTKEGKEFL